VTGEGKVREHLREINSVTPFSGFRTRSKLPAQKPSQRSGNGRKKDMNQPSSSTRWFWPVPPYLMFLCPEWWPLQRKRKRGLPEQRVDRGSLRPR